MKIGQYTAPLERRAKRLAKQEDFLDDEGKVNCGAIATATGLHRETVKNILGLKSTLDVVPVEKEPAKVEKEEEEKKPARGKRGVEI